MYNLGTNLHNTLYLLFFQSDRKGTKVHIFSSPLTQGIYSVYQKINSY